MKKLKRIIIVLMVLALVAVGGLVWLYLSLGAVIKAGIEKFGSDITQTPITVQSVEVWPLTGSGTIRNLVIGNPEGYKTDHALALPEVRFRLDVASLKTDTIVIEEIYIDSPAITYEVGFGNSNLTTIQKNIESFLPESEDKPDEFGKNTNIKSVVLKNGEIALSAKIMMGRKVTIYLPPMELENINTNSPVKAGAKVLGALLNAAIGAVDESDQAPAP